MAADEQLVGSVGRQGVGDVDLKGVVAVEAAADVLAVDVDAAVVFHAVELDLDAAAGPSGG